MKKIKTIFIFCGILLILAALALCCYNIVQNNKAYNESQKVMKELIKLIPEQSTQTSAEKNSENPADDLFSSYQQEIDNAAAPVPVSVNGRDYCGYITLPSLELELPVIDRCSYEALEISPCRFSGTAYESDLIIAAHNYNSHFGRIADLDYGDDVLFTDTCGKVYRYKVDDISVLDGSDSEGMFFGKKDSWDITLFTCTLSGRSRVAVRGCRYDE